jgi:hypothetical protein
MARHSTPVHERLMLTVLGGLAECKLPNSKPDPIRSIKIPSKYSYQTNSYKVLGNSDSLSKSAFPHRQRRRLRDSSAPALRP